MEVMDRGPIVIRRRLGSALKQLRAGKGLQLDKVARDLEMSPAKLSRLETGQVTPKVRDVRDLLEEYDAPEAVRLQLLALAEEAKDQGWWQPLSAEVPGDLGLYISLEAEAATMKIFAYCIPSLLETRDYASLVLYGLAPQRTEEHHRELLDIRMRRQEVLHRGPDRVAPPRLHVIMDESVLHRAPAPTDTQDTEDPAEAVKRQDEIREIMHAQLTELARLSRSETVTVQIFPYAAGFSQAQSLFTIFEPREQSDEPTVCVESTGRDAYYEGTAELAKYREIWADLESRAMSPSDSRELITAKAETWRSNSVPE